MTIDTRELAAIDPGTWYSAEAVGRVFRRSARTVRRWCRAGALAHATDPFDPRRVLVVGSVLRAKAAELILESAPVDTETTRQRESRARRDLADIRKLVGSRG